jgi:nucleoside-diphosphate-sugar epimerase
MNLTDVAIDSMRGFTEEALQERSILITGVTGLIGINLLYALVEFIKLHSLSTKIYTISKSSLPEDIINSVTKHIIADLSTPFDLGGLAFDYIIHAATYSQPQLFEADPITTITLNTTTVMALLKLLKPQGRFLFLSSSEVYSGLTSSPFVEEQIGTTTPSHLRACYIESKRVGETICNAYNKFTNEGSAKIVRLSLGFGPGVKKGDRRVINNFIERGLANHRIDLHDSGEAIRTYCYISDMIYMMSKVLFEGKDVLYNIGGKETVTIKELATSIGYLLDVPIFIPGNTIYRVLPGSPNIVKMSINKFEEEFGEINLLPIYAGIERTIEWIRSL